MPASSNVAISSSRASASAASRMGSTCTAPSPLQGVSPALRAARAPVAAALPDVRSQRSDGLPRGGGAQVGGHQCRRSSDEPIHHHYNSTCRRSKYHAHQRGESRVRPPRRAPRAAAWDPTVAAEAHVRSRQPFSAR
jgi:hypothetical protein